MAALVASVLDILIASRHEFSSPLEIGEATALCRGIEHLTGVLRRYRQQDQDEGVKGTLIADERHTLLQVGAPIQPKWPALALTISISDAELWLTSFQVAMEIAPLHETVALPIISLLVQSAHVNTPRSPLFTSPES